MQVGSGYSLNYVWDTNTLAWVPETQPGSGGGGAVTIADGADVTQGAIADAAVTGDNSGTVNAHLRGLTKILADVWDSVNHWFKVSIQNATLAVTQSGSWVLSAGSAIIGKVSIDQTTPGTTNGVQVVAALPAGANAIGKLAANSGVTIGAVEIAAAQTLATVTTVGSISTSVTPGTAATNLGKAEDAVHSSGDVGVFALHVANEAQTTLAADGDYIANTTDTKGNSLTVGNIAHGTADAGNPLKIGGKAASAAPTAVTAAQRVNALFDLWGRLFVRHGMQAPSASTWTVTHVPATNTQATATQASAGAGKRNVCTGFTVTLAAGASAATPGAPISVSVRDGASGAGTVKWTTIITMPAQAGSIVSFNRSGLWIVGSQATAMTVEFSGAGGANTYESVSMDGVIVEE